MPRVWVPPLPPILMPEYPSSQREHPCKMSRKLRECKSLLRLNFNPNSPKELPIRNCLTSWSMFPEQWYALLTLCDGSCRRRYGVGADSYAQHSVLHLKRCSHRCAMWDYPWWKNPAPFFDGFFGRKRTIFFVVFGRWCNLDSDWTLQFQVKVV